MASTSASAVVIQGLTTPFLSKSSARSLFAGSRVNNASIGQRKLIVAAAAAGKKSWIPAVKGGGNLVDPEW
ncbi:hypothetical protein, partial [Mycobacterium tuberculosis]|uniref:hypothetical protein n=1 Tax=Mycobacterium tuberculosis TaxID=1773 RepID=UPI00254A1668